MAFGYERVIALDPGGRSGWASADMKPDEFVLTGGGVLRQDLMARWFADQQNLLDEAQMPGFGKAFDTMVIESWFPRRQNGSMDWIEGDPLLSAQHVGQLRFIADVTDTKIVTQHPSDKPLALATMPKALADLDRYSNEQHDKDARMHLWLYFWRNYFTGQHRPDAPGLVVL